MSIFTQPAFVAAFAVALALTGVAASAGEAAPGTAVPAPPAARPDASVAPLTVTPETKAVGKVVSSTDAAPLVAPDFTADDARSPPLAVRLSPNSALGRQAPPPSGAPGGVLNTNPDLPGGFRSDDVGVTVLF